MEHMKHRPHIAGSCPRPLTEARVRAIAREEVDVYLDEMAEQALAALRRHDG